MPPVPYRLPTPDQVLRNMHPITGFAPYQIVFASENGQERPKTVAVDLVVRRRWYNLFSPTVEVAGRTEFQYDEGGAPQPMLRRVVHHSKSLYVFLRGIGSLTDGTAVVLREGE